MKNITIFGNLSKDAEVRTTPQGQDVCGFDVAVNDRRTKETYWFSVSYWGKAGTAVSPYLKKGQPVVVTGEMSWRDYNDKKYLQINANSLALAGSPKKGEGNYSFDKKPAASQIQGSNSDLDDEIPF
tara:strand:- start:692 stop:1072 length:381 start_codon:yes stop_codon:yes gene_type:complete